MKMLITVMMLLSVTSVFANCTVGGSCDTSDECKAKDAKNIFDSATKTCKAAPADVTTGQVASPCPVGMNEGNPQTAPVRTTTDGKKDAVAAPDKSL